MGLEPAISAAQGVFAAKTRRRAALACLSFEEKVRVLIQLQRIASSVVAASGRVARTPWQIDNSENPSDRAPGRG
ncbi:MAG: hypothetical protein GX464_04900 [Holophagae bacterium]|nr:hypothetical protein [Holophagae bacterium]